MEGTDGLIGEKIFVILKSGRQYSGEVKNNENNLITLTDKFGEIVLFNISEISSLEVENE